MIEMSVETVRINLAMQQRVVILKALNEDRYLLIWIANAEAYAIAVQLQGTVSPRPLTHDLVKSLIERMGAKVIRVMISDLIDEIFYARIVLELAGQELEFDARPSDAIALAVRVPVPIFVTEEVLELSGVNIDPKEEAAAPQAKTEEAATSEAEMEEAEPQQVKGETATTQAKAEAADLRQAEHRSYGKQEQAAESTKLYKEITDVIALEARLARVEEELRRARERIAELEGE